MEVAAASLRPFPLFRQAPEQVLAALASRSERVMFEHGEVLWRTGDPPDHAHFIVRGLVQAVKRMPNGDEILLALFGPSEIAGFLAGLGLGVYPADALVASDTVQLIRIPTVDLKAAIAADAGLACAANTVLIAHSLLLRAKIDVLTAGEIPQRLATLLLHLAERFGDVAETGELIIPVVLSRGSLARLVGAREETVIRVMTRWERAGLVETVKSGFIVKTTAELELLQIGAE